MVYSNCYELEIPLSYSAFMELNRLTIQSLILGSGASPFPPFFHPCIVLYLIDVLGTILQQGEIMHVYRQSSFLKLGRQNYCDYQLLRGSFMISETYLTLQTGCLASIRAASLKFIMTVFVINAHAGIQCNAYGKANSFRAFTWSLFGPERYKVRFKANLLDNLSQLFPYDNVRNLQN